MKKECFLVFNVYQIYHIKETCPTTDPPVQQGRIILYTYNIHYWLLEKFRESCTSPLPSSLNVFPMGLPITKSELKTLFWGPEVLSNS